MSMMKFTTAIPIHFVIKGVYNICIGSNECSAHIIVRGCMLTFHIFLDHCATIA